jgi:myosin-5
VHKKLRIEAAALRVQKNFRRYVDRKSFVTTRSSTIVLQTGLRAMIARSEFRLRRQRKAAIVLQAHWRGRQAFSYYTRLQKAAIVTQCAWRCRLARRELRMLKMAARDTGALKDAKNKLEQRVEELSLRLHLEKRLRTDLEEAKVQEVAKLQEALHTMRLQLKETTAMVVKEQEAARVAIEEASSVNKEPVVVEDTEKIDSLSNEIDRLKGLLSSETHKADEAQHAYQSALVQNEELCKKLEEAGRKIDQLQDSVQRFQEKVFSLESENKVLRQQTLTISPTTRALALRPKTTIIQVLVDTGYVFTLNFLTVNMTFLIFPWNFRELRRRILSPMEKQHNFRNLKLRIGPRNRLIRNSRKIKSCY